MTTYAWTVNGSASSYHGTLNPGVEDSGTLAAEGAGEVVEWLAEHGPFWDLLDQDKPVTITIHPVPAEQTSEQSTEGNWLLREFDRASDQYNALPRDGRPIITPPARSERRSGFACRIPHCGHDHGTDDNGEDS